MADSEYRPDQPSLLGSRLKIKRAEQHLEELEPEIRAYVKRDPYRISEKPDAEGEWMVVRFVEIREYPDPAWGVRVGELLHDLRSALDNLVWQLIRLNGKEPGDQSQFPIYTKPPRKARVVKTPGATRIDDMLIGMRVGHATTIKALQPYLGEHAHRRQKIALAAVATLNNIDKHRFLHPAVGVREKGEGGKATLNAGPAPKEIEAVFTTGPIYPGAELIRWRVIGGGEETTVTVEGEVPYDIAFGHPNTTLGHLDWLQEGIGQIIESFAPAFPANPDGS